MSDTSNIKPESLSVPKGLYFKNNALYTKDSDSSEEKKVCAPFEIIGCGYTNDKSSPSWSRIFSFADAKGEKYTIPVSDADFSGTSCESVLKLLRRSGLRIYDDKLFIRLVRNFYPEKKYITTDTPGWDKSLDFYVFPEQVIGKTPDDVVFTDDTAHLIFEKKGTIEQYQKTVTSKISGNPFGVVAICNALSGILIPYFPDFEGGGLLFYGDSGCGKSTCASLAQSVYGSIEKVCFSSFDGSETGIINHAASHHHGCFCCEELKKNKRNIIDCVYNISNGIEPDKSKPKGDGTYNARRKKQFSVVLSCTGEASLSDLAASVGETVPSGADARLLSVPLKIDDQDTKAFEHDLHGFPTSEIYVRYLQTSMVACHGVLSRAFVSELIHRGKNEITGEEVMSVLNRLYEDIRQEYGEYPGDQVKRILRKRIAPVIIAGNLATEYGLTGFADDEVYQSVKYITFRWLSIYRETLGAVEANAIFEQVADMFTADGRRDFRDFAKGSPCPHDKIGIRMPGTEALGKAGLPDCSSYDNLYLITPKMLKKRTSSGKRFKSDIRRLYRRGWLISDKSCNIYIPSEDKTMGCYVFSDAPYKWKGSSLVSKSTSAAPENDERPVISATSPEWNDLLKSLYRGFITMEEVDKRYKVNPEHRSYLLNAERKINNPC